MCAAVLKKRALKITGLKANGCVFMLINSWPYDLLDFQNDSYRELTVN